MKLKNIIYFLIKDFIKKSIKIAQLEKMIQETIIKMQNQI
jgi:hypothetical protein